MKDIRTKFEDALELGFDLPEEIEKRENMGIVIWNPDWLVWTY